jgi:sterol desaturase/sphingolipid hydroxylase (fatty acid hydroxylase superfamily)
MPRFGLFSGGRLLDVVIMWTALAGLLGVAERLVPATSERTPVAARAWTTDAGWLLLYLLYVPALGGLLGATTTLIGAHSPLHQAMRQVPLGGQIALVFVIAEAVAYAVHRLQHAAPALWRMHSIHHTSSTLRWWSAFRAHPLDTVVSHGVPLLVAALGGFTPSAFIPYLATVTVVTAFAHADVALPLTALDRLVVTPRFHRSHHEVGRDRSNFGRALSLFDVAFGTAAWFADVRPFGTSGTGGRPPAEGTLAQLRWGFGLRRPRRAHRSMATPNTNDPMFAAALATSDVIDENPRQRMISASPSTTATSMTASAAMAPITPSSTGYNSKNASGCETRFTMTPSASASGQADLAARARAIP